MSGRKKKPAARKPAAKSASRAAARRPATAAAKAHRKAAPRKAAARKPAPRKAAPPKAVARKAPPRKVAAPKAVPRKAAAPKVAAPKAVTPKVAAPKAAASSPPPNASATPVERVRVDEPVADFTAAATGGLQWRLYDARGRKLVLYFYPRDNTPGCTLEGQQFSALAPQFAAAEVTVLGVSRDSLASHEKFRQQMGFPFDLLSDTGETICRQFDVIREKNMYGRKVLGIERSTFLLDAAGVLKREWRGVKVDGHAQEVLAAALAL